jgi:hypothetical protein
MTAARVRPRARTRHADGQAIGALDLYSTDTREGSPKDLRVAGILAAIATNFLLHASALKQQRRTSEQLQQALDTRIIIEQAKGTLATARDVGVDEAFRIMRKHSRDHNLRLHDVAHAVVPADYDPSRDVPHRRPRPVSGHRPAAVAVAD